MIRHFNIGVKNGFRMWRICLIVYGIQLLLAIPFGLQVYQVVEASIGNSWELDHLLLEYDHTVYSDFLNKHGASITPILGQLRWLILIYFVISVFIHSGVLFCIFRKKYRWPSFWHGASVCFYPFLKIALIFLALFLLWSILIWLPVLNFFQTAIELLPSEKSFLLICLIALIIFLLGALFLFNASLGSRFYYLNGNKSWFKSVTKGLKWAFRFYIKSTSLLFLYILSLILIFFIYLLIENNPGMVSALLVLVYLVLQQLFVLFRIIWRVASYSGMYSLFQKTKI
jgi:hypothetical protein